MLAYQVLQPQFSSMPPGPEAYYNAYRRLHVTQRLNTVSLDVDGFLPKVSEPSDAEVGALFASALTKFPNEDSPGSPGFRQPLKVKLGYLEVSRSKIEPTIAAVTDEDIQKQYDENKDTLYR
ncbi:MAG: hypothetical protein ACK58T_00785, partial [Phycisphaerae bacterium]